MLDDENGATGKENLIMESGLNAHIFYAHHDVKDGSAYSIRKASAIDASTQQAASLFSSNVALPQCTVVKKFRILKGEDTAVAETSVGLPGDTGLDFHVFAVFDGHSGRNASEFCKSSLLDEMLPRLPTTSMPSESDSAGFQAYLLHLRCALLDSFLAVNRKIILTKSGGGGCTASVVLVTGWVVTVANVGDSLVYVETNDRGMEMVGADHRLNSNETEVNRLKNLGYKVARVTSDFAVGGPAREGEYGIGPLRVWPGGLNLGRAIGDGVVGEGLLPFPHITQLKVPPTGARFLIASDGVWDTRRCTEQRVGRMLRSGTRNEAASVILREATRRLHDDTTLLVVDVLPEGTDDYISDKERIGCMPFFFGGKRTNRVEPLSDADEASSLQVLCSVDTMPEQPLKDGATFSAKQQQGNSKRIHSISADRHAALYYKNEADDPLKPNSLPTIASVEDFQAESKHEDPREANEELMDQLFATTDSAPKASLSAPNNSIALISRTSSCSSVETIVLSNTYTSSIV